MSVTWLCIYMTANQLVKKCFKYLLKKIYWHKTPNLKVRLNFRSILGFTSFAFRFWESFSFSSMISLKKNK